MIAGPPEFQSTEWTASVPPYDELPGGTRTYMTSIGKIHVRVSYKWIAILLFTCGLSLLTANPAQAQSDGCVSTYGGLIDGYVNPVPPAHVQIDGNCTIRNFPASNPFTSNVSWYGNNPTSWLLVFDNVIFTGNMSCSLQSQGNFIWFTNGSTSTIKASCQNLFVPTEKIIKENPAGKTTATIGVPFTYKLTIPVLFDPITGTVINNSGSTNDLHDITITDDLNATGADLSFVSEKAYWLNGTPIPHTFSNAGGVLTFAGFPVVPAGQQFVIEVTAVLNDTPANAPGKQFVNTAKWEFGRLIGGVFHEPLPGEWGVSPPMTIAAPVLTLTKSGPATMNLGQWGNFAIDIQNTGLSDAWNASIRDQLPTGATGGMCDRTPEILSAQVFGSDGVTPVAGKGPLNSGSDYSVSYSAAPTCRLDITVLTSAGSIGPNQRLIIRYRTKLDATTQNSVTLTNVAGAIQWFNGDSSNPNRKPSIRTLTNGTPGVTDHEDAFTVTVALTGYFFDKTVADLTSGASPAATATPGDRLRYTLRFRTTSDALSNFSIVDDLDALNAKAAFEPGTLTIVASPAGADVSATSPTGGTKGTGVVDIRNLNLPVNGEALVQFDITLKPVIANGTLVSNQATSRLANGTVIAWSDDPGVNGPADPTVSGDEDPTRVTITSAPAFRVQKISTDLTDDPNLLLPGERLRYTITVKNIGTDNAVNAVLRDAIPANTTYVPGSTTLNGPAVWDLSGVSPVVNGMRIISPSDQNPGSMPADPSSNPANVATITFDVVVNAGVAGGTVISNQGFVSANGIVDQPSDDPRTPAANDPTLNIVAVSSAPVLVVTKSGPATMNLGQWGTFGIDVQNTGLGEAWNASIRDQLPAGATGGMCGLKPEILSAQVFASDGVTPAPGKGPLSAGSDYSVNYSGAPTCRLDIAILTATGRIGLNERLIIRYRTQLDANTQNGVTLTNIAGAVQWFDGDSSNVNRKTSTRTLTNGTPGIADHEDAHTVTAALSGYFFEKTVADLTSGANPATTAAPGDKLRYTLRFRTTSQALSNFRIVDEMDALNAQADFAAGTLTLVASPAGADVSATSSTGGSKGTGVVDVRNLNLAANGEAQIQFDITLKAALPNGIVVANQSTARQADGTVVALSDDPNVNGTADPTVSGDEDPTRVTIAAVTTPLLVVTKSGPATMNLGQWGTFSMDIQNAGLSDAWNASMRDQLPAGATGGMCDLKPEILSAQVFAADGVTAAPGKGPLSAGTDYAMSYSVAPTCRLDLTILTDKGRIGPSERLIIRYRTQLDANTQNGVTLTNVAGAIQWFDADSSNVNRKSFTHTLTNGTPGIADFEDAHSVTTALSGYFFEKTVADLTSGVNPATTAAPGDKLRYTLRFRTISQALSNFRIVDELDALNAQADFAPGTLTLVASPSGADTSATSSTGGAKGTGVVDVRNLNLAANGEAVIQFDITLKPTIANGTIVANQSAVRIANGTVFALSDDPNVNGTADPAVSGDEDPTRITIASPPAFRVQKISTDMTGDPNVLLAGETLRYTITVKNTSDANAVNVALRDSVPANTAYVAGSTTLNGAAVADVAGVSQLVNGMPINPPGGTPGSMPADAGSPANVATITFDVVVNSNTADGTVISNQGFVSGTGFVDQPSDDPRTSAPNDPTRDIVGNKPKLYAEKRVALFGDLGSPGIVDPGDVLRYTITVKNSATVAATGVVLTDSVPANTTYVADSTLLNGSPVGQPDGGASPLASGINAGTIAAGATAVLQFDLRVNAGTPVGTVISNQAMVSSTGLPNLPTDGDGNPTTGPEPTVVVVGARQQVSISNQVSVVGGGAAVPGAQLEYVVKVVNTEAVPAFYVVITDDLNATKPGQLSYVNQSATLNGSATGIDFAGSTITYNFGAINGPLAPGGVAELKFRAVLASNLATGTTVTNTSVATWNNPAQTASASSSIVVGAIPGFAILNGSAWHDANFNDARDSGERALTGWTVDLYRDNQLSQSAVTDANGDYRIINIEPNDTNGVKYELRFRAPGAGANTALLGRAVSPFTNGLQRISGIVVQSNANLQGMNLAIHPNGVIYNSQSRAPVAGATLTLMDARSASSLAAACFDDAAQQGQITLADGYYKFDINFSDPSCPTGGDYLIGVAVPSGTNYVAGYSQIIPPASSAATAAFSVPACLSSAADAVPATAKFCEVQASEFAPGTSVPPRSAGTTYHVHMMLDGSQMPGSSQIFNNHIPIDPQLTGAVTISKSTPLLNVTRAQLVPYVITVKNAAGTMLTDLNIVDRLPAGFSYVKGSALIDGVPAEPSVAGGTLSWSGLTLSGKQTSTVKLLVTVGGGVSEGEFVNRAQVLNAVTGNAMSGEATASVRLMADLTFDCTDVTGKVFNDANRNGIQDDGEKGLPGVRVVTARGLAAITDQFGRYHMTCATTPNESRGSNFVLKLDDRTLPSGFRMSTDKMKIQRATRGKTLQVNFAASIHRVISIDLMDEAFDSNSTEIRVQWKPRLDLLLEELQKAPAVLRLSYVADTEDEALVKRRVEAIKRQLTESWDAQKYGYVLTIEPEVFWRRGAPAKRPDVRRPER